MATITLQLGQCGNQVGQSALDALHDDAGPDERYFRRVPRRGGGEDAIVARAVLVDMEPKAVRAAAATALATGRWSYASSREHYEQGGSGNNWAHGYCEHGPKCWPSVRELVRAELEACDRANGVLLYQALAGGTGSGVGAHLTAALRDEWPELFRANVAVWPRERGDVAVQPYNCALSLSTLCGAADAVLLLENDVLEHVCSRVLRIGRPSHDDLNKLLARHLVPILAPSAPSAASHGGGSVTPSARAPTAAADASGSLSLLGAPLQHLCPHPAYKLLCVRMVPQTPAASLGYTADRWTAVLRPLAQMAATDGRLEDQIDWRGTPSGSVARAASRALAAWLVLRGPGALEEPPGPLARPDMFSRWVPGAPLLTSASERHVQGHDKTATLVSNSQLVLPPMQRIVSRACALFSARAYVHQYERHGMAADELCLQLAALERVCHSYAELGGPVASA